MKTMLTTLNIDIDIPSTCMYDLESLKYKAKEYLEILIKPAKGILEKEKEEEYDIKMLREEAVPFTVKELKDRIHQSVKDAEDGKGITLEQFEKEVDELYKNL